MALKKTVDAIKDSRKWRMAASKRMAMMSTKERIAYLNADTEARLQSLRKPKKSSGKNLASVLVDNNL